MNRPIFVREKQGAFEVTARVDRVGDDILVVLTGGKAHLGAVAICRPTQGAGDSKQAEGSGSVFALAGHKDDVVAKAMAGKLAGKLLRTVVVAAGMHWDGVTREDIDLIVAMCGTISKKIGALADRGDV